MDRLWTSGSMGNGRSTSKSPAVGLIWWCHFVCFMGFVVLLMYKIGFALYSERDSMGAPHSIFELLFSMCVLQSSSAC